MSSDTSINTSESPLASKEGSFSADTEEEKEHVTEPVVEADAGNNPNATLNELIHDADW